MLFTRYICAVIELSASFRASIYYPCSKVLFSSLRAEAGVYKHSASNAWCNDQAFVQDCGGFLGFGLVQTSDGETIHRPQ